MWSKIKDYVQNQPTIIHIYGSTRSYLHKHNIMKRKNFTANEIIPGLYLGDIYDAHNLKGLQERNISKILTIAASIKPAYPEKFTYLNLEARDTLQEDVLPSYFKQSNEFISTAIENNENILVHCMQGRSRSATLVIAYLIKHHKYEARDAQKLLKEKRSVVGPNDHFMQQLIQYQENMSQDSD